MIYTQIFSTPREVLYDDSEGRFTLSRHLEFIAGQWRTRIHFDVFYFAPSVLREIDRIFPILRAQLPPVISAVLDHTRPVGPHYMRRFGFVPVGNGIPYDDGEMHPFWVHVRD